MQKRNVEIKFRLDKKEAESLNKRVRKSGLSRESYLRHLINDLLPTDVPPPDYYNMMRTLHGIVTPFSTRMRGGTLWMTNTASSVTPQGGTAGSHTARRGLGYLGPAPANFCKGGGHF